MLFELWMRNAHESRLFSGAGAGRLAAAQTRQLRVAHAGVLAVQDGPLWLTREGDPDDHVLNPGERLRLQAGDRVTVGAWRHAQASTWQWQPDRTRPVGRRFERALVLWLTGGLDWLARGLEGWAALARKAPASAAARHGGGVICPGPAAPAQSAPS